MPSARDLLQKADTLMRSNRNVGASDLREEIPLLTDIVVPGSPGVSHREQHDEIPVPADTPTAIPPEASGPSLQSEAHVGLEATEPRQYDTIFPVSQMPHLNVQAPAPSEQQAEPVFSVTALHAQLAYAEDSGAEPIAPERSSPPPLVAEPATSAAELAETVYYQVLQNLDLYTERALQEHLTTHLSPILERASHELLATLHANLGALIRQYVAEAIEKQLGVRPGSGK